MILVKNAGPDQVPMIQGLAKKTWPVAYSAILQPGQLEYMLELFYSTGALQQQIDQGHRFILAAENNDALGFASFSPVQEIKEDTDTTDQERKIHLYRLHKLYIAPEYQGKGIGKFLLDHIVQEIMASGAGGLELNVNRFNKALHFYFRYGFKVIRDEDIDIGNGYFMNDHVMRLDIY